MEKVKNIFKNKYFILLLITMLAAAIRLVNLDRPYGLWYDEMMVYIFATEKFPLGILKSLWQQEYHMPLYYLFIHIWIKLFGNSDFILRLSSLLFGALTIPALFLLGKTYKSEKLGFLLSAFGCISPILIYYSQEFRFYSILIFFSVISLTYFLKLTEKFDKKSLLLFWFSNLIILYIYTMGIVFIATEVFLLILNYYLYDKNKIKAFVKHSIIPIILSIPYFILLWNIIYGSNHVFVDPFGWGQPDAYPISQVFIDWFSPYISNIYSSGPEPNIPRNNYFPILKVIMPLLFIFCFFRGLKNNAKKLYYLCTILFSFFACFFFLRIFGHIVWCNRYTLVVLPIIFLICIDGLLSFKIKYSKQIFISIIFFVYISSFIINGLSPVIQPDGVKYPAEFISYLNPHGDYLITVKGTNLCEKYIKNVNFIDFDSLKISHLDKTKSEDLKIFDKTFVEETTKYNSIPKLIPYFLSYQPTKHLQSFIDKQVTKIPKGKRLFVIDGPNYYGEIDKEHIVNYTNQCVNGLVTQNDFKNNLFNLLNNKISLDIHTALKNNLSLIKIETIPTSLYNKYIRCSWIITVYKKI